MSEFVIHSYDELAHPPGPEVNFNESVYVNGFDAKTGTGGWLRLGNRVNEGHAELSVCLYLPGGRIACSFRRPSISANDRFDAGGLVYTVLEPFRSIEIRYEGELYIVDDPEALRDPQSLFARGADATGHVRLKVVAESPIHGGAPAHDGVQTMHGRDFSLGHFNQHGRISGEIQVGAEAFPIDGRGWRDHSWGPRYWQVIYYYRLFLANFENGDGFMLLKLTDRSGHARRVSVLLVDRQYEEITDLDAITDWTGAQDPQRVRLGVRTANRKALITAEILTLAPLRNRRCVDGETLVSRIAEGHTRFDWDGKSGFGMTEYIERIEDGKLAGYPL
jgi:hypothetical protein